MKKISLSITFFLLTSVLWAQSHVEFEKYIELFYPCDYPYVASHDFSKMTKVNTSIGTIDENLLKIFVYDQKIKKVGLACGVKYFEDYYSFIQFPPTDSVYVVTLSPIMTDAACGEGLLLATYSKYNYQLQDTLWIDVRGALPPQFIDELQAVCNLDIESSLTSDSICVKKVETHFLRDIHKNRIPTKKIKITVIQTTYKMTGGGKFIKIREHREDNILDPMANRLK